MATNLPAKVKKGEGLPADFDEARDHPRRGCEITVSAYMGKCSSTEEQIEGRPVGRPSAFRAPSSPSADLVVAAEQLAREGAGALVVLEGDAAVDQDVAHAGGLLDQAPLAAREVGGELGLVV